ncbi:GDSL-type esterase/lipase family protein [Oleiharenicola lentus]|uniref:GDSL-type esterase/lipase family protein n=1 Tax=Oleiharenicola lentus TaxID=2508720 RepID=UPI003F680588
MNKKLRFLAPVFAGLFSLAIAQTSAPATVPPKPVDPTVGIPKRANPAFYELHAEFLKRTKSGPIGLLFIGDSITHGWRKAPETWEQYYSKYQPANFGIGGDQTQHVIWRIEDGELDGIKPKVVVVMIGTNNSGAHTAPQILAANTKIVELIRAKLPKTKVLMLAIFPRGPRKDKQGVVTDDGVSRMNVINEVNAGLAKLDDGKNVRFLDITKAWLGADGKIPDSVMPDQLHPTGPSYKLWAEAMDPLLTEMMK